jgi:hypothetical protein
MKNAKKYATSYKINKNMAWIYTMVIFYIMYYINLPVLRTQYVKVVRKDISK